MKTVAGHLNGVIGILLVKLDVNVRDGREIVPVYLLSDEEDGSVTDVVWGTGCAS